MSTVAKRDLGIPTPGTCLHVGIVTGGRYVLHLVVASSRAALEAQLAGYVAQHASDHLYAADAERVHELLSVTRRAEAVDHYFATVGRRWDAERLSIHLVPLESEHAEKQFRNGDNPS